MFSVTNSNTKNLVKHFVQIIITSEVQIQRLEALRWIKVDLATFGDCDNLKSLFLSVFTHMHLHEIFLFFFTIPAHSH